MRRSRLTEEQIVGLLKARGWLGNRDARRRARGDPRICGPVRGERAAGVLGD